MSIELVAQVMRDAFIRILLIAGPSVLVALTVGLVISVFQATTQIQEQTLSFVPKLLAIFLTLMLTGYLMFYFMIFFYLYIFLFFLIYLIPKDTHKLYSLLSYYNLDFLN